MSKLYKKSGVDVIKTDNLISQALKFIKTTHNSNVLGNKLGFSAEYKVNKEVTLCSATDGVGTKAILAAELNEYKGIGQDLLGMCSNDLLCNKAKPLFFLDYFACSSVDPKQYTEILKSLTKACKKINCALIGGETAEMPSLYQGNHFDMAGFLVGIKHKQKIESIKSGDLIIGIKSNGFHSNGYSLINKIIANNITDKLLTDLLVPTKIYVKEILELLDHVEVNGMAHITGGGFEENLSRINNGLTINIDRNKWQLPKIFRDIQDLGNIETEEMFRVFNCGIGYAVVLSEANAKKAKTLNSDFIEIGLVSKKEDSTFKYI